jgi:hypothetical protein
MGVLVLRPFNIPCGNPGGNATLGTFATIAAAGVFTLNQERAAAFCFVEDIARGIHILTDAGAIAYLHIFKSAEGPEVVREVIVRDVIVRHCEITVDTPVRAPGVADEHTLA